MMVLINLTYFMTTYYLLDFGLSAQYEAVSWIGINSHGMALCASEGTQAIRKANKEKKGG